MTRQSWAVAGLMLRNMRLLAATTAVIAFLACDLIWVFPGGARLYGTSNWLFFVPVFAGLGVSVGHFPAVMGLGARRSSFFWGAAMVHALLAVGVALLDTVLYYAVDRRVSGAYTFADAFGWAGHGPAVVFAQQLALLLFLAVLMHMIGLVVNWESAWGWVAATPVCVALFGLPVWTAVAPGSLQAFLGGLPPVWIAAGLVLAAGLYAATWPLLAATPVPAGILPATTLTTLARRRERRVGPVIFTNYTS